jgi:hypothetical protein
LVLVFITILIGIGVLDYFHIISLREISATWFVSLAFNPWILGVLIGISLASYWLNYSYLRSHAYIEEIGSNKDKKEFKSVDTSFLDKFGHIGDLIQVEIRLILRNKRSKSMLLISVLLLFYGFIFYPQDVYAESFGMFTFVGIFMTGIFVANYGQLLLSWNSSFFDKILTSNIEMKTFFESKFWMFVFTSSVAYLLTIPYVFFGWKILIINTACFLFNIGFNTYTALYFAMKNPKRIDLNKSATFNYEGITATQFIQMIPMLALPAILAFVFDLLGYGYLGIGFLALLGTLGLIFKKRIFQFLSSRFYERKHLIASGLRKE